MDQTETYCDQPLRFSIPGRNARGRVVRLGPVLADILSAHVYPPAIERTLSEALVLAALLGSLLKDKGDQLTMQAQTENGVISLLVCDYREGKLRGYVEFDAERLASMPADPSLFALFGKGYLAITFDPAQGGRYQGIVPLEGASLADAAEHYFVQSEQLPTLIRIAACHGDEGPVAAGLLVQHLPEGEEGRGRLHVDLDHPEWEHVAIMAGSIRAEELTDKALSMETIVWRLFHEEAETRIDLGLQLAKGCRCDVSHIRDVLARFPRADRHGMADEEGNIVVDCAFCSKNFPVSLASLDN